MEQYHEAIWPQLTPIFFYFSKLPSDSDDFELEADQSQLNCYDYLELVIFSTNQTTEICGNSYDQDIGSNHILGSDWTMLEPMKGFCFEQRYKHRCILFILWWIFNQFWGLGFKPFSFVNKAVRGVSYYKTEILWKSLITCIDMHENPQIKHSKVRKPYYKTFSNSSILK